MEEENMKLMIRCKQNGALNIRRKTHTYTHLTGKKPLRVEENLYIIVLMLLNKSRWMEKDTLKQKSSWFVVYIFVTFFNGKNQKVNSCLPKLFPFRTEEEEAKESLLRQTKIYWCVNIVINQRSERVRGKQ